MSQAKDAIGTDETLESSPEHKPPISEPTDDHDAFIETAPERYEFAGELGRGGMGRIVIARDRRLRRPVALKELLTIDRPESVRRFVREALITARLQHPSIVRLYDAGRFPNGQQFFSLEMVRGLPFDRVLARCRTLDERLALLPNLLAACDALAYAHAQRIIHRDLKPQNVLCGSYGETVVIDWGLAKDLAEPEWSGDATAPSDGAGDVGDTSLTRLGAIMGTPSFMPPEQARGEQVDERADVYALGAMLYTLLCGSAPYRGRTADEVLDRVLKGPPEPIDQRQPDAPPELCTVVAKAMAYDKQQRYPTATELTEELRRFQTGQLIASHRYSRGELARRFLRRNRGPVAVGAAATALLLVGSVASVQRIRQERDRARAAELAAVNAHDALERKNEDLVFQQARRSIVSDATTALAWLRELGASSKRLGEAHALAVEACQRGISRIFRGAKDDVSHLRTAGTELVSGSDDHRVRLLHPKDGTSTELSGHNAPVSALAVSHDATRAASGSFDQNVRLWRLAAATSDVLHGHKGTIRDLVFSADDKYLASASEDQTIRIWNLATHQSIVLERHKGGVRTLCFAPEALYSGAQDGLILAWEGPSYTPRIVGRHTGTVRAVRRSPDGRFLASAGEDGLVLLFRLGSKEAPRTLLTSADVVRSLLFSSDGRWLAAAGADGLVRLWRIDGDALTAIELKGHEGAIKALAFSPDGSVLASGGADRLVLLWDLDKRTSRPLRGHSAAVKSIAFLPDGRIASASDDDTVRLWVLDAKPPESPRGLAAWLGQVVPWRVTESEGAR